MEESTVKLTPADRAILESYKGLCEGLADYLGDGYEIVLHSLENFENSVIKIINGYYTGRKEGAPITDLALHMLENIRERNGAGYLSYLTKNKKGEPMRSTTITIKGEGGQTIGLLCINFYMNTPFAKWIANFYEQKAGAEANSSENFVDDPTELIAEAVVQVREDVLADVSITTHNKNKEIVTRLAARGIFKLKDSVIQCADILGISRNTVYMHIRNGKS